MWDIGVLALLQKIRERTPHWARGSPGFHTYALTGKSPKVARDNLCTELIFAASHGGCAPLSVVHHWALCRASGTSALHEYISNLLICSIHESLLGMYYTCTSTVKIPLPNLQHITIMTKWDKLGRKMWHGVKRLSLRLVDTMLPIVATVFSQTVLQQ